MEIFMVHRNSFHFLWQHFATLTRQTQSVMYCDALYKLTHTIDQSINQVQFPKVAYGSLTVLVNPAFHHKTNGYLLYPATISTISAGAPLHWVTLKMGSFQNAFCLKRNTMPKKAPLTAAVRSNRLIPTRTGQNQNKIHRCKRVRIAAIRLLHCVRTVIEPQVRPLFGYNKDSCGSRHFSWGGGHEA